MDVVGTTEVAFTLLDAGRAIEIGARLAGDRVRLPATALESALGWRLEGDVLCSTGACVAVPEGIALEATGGVDLEALAALLGRPLVLDVAERAAYLGVPAAERRRALSALEAPDFTLPDLFGRPHALSQQAGRKVLLLAWASW